MVNNAVANVASFINKQVIDSPLPFVILPYLIRNNTILLVYVWCERNHS